NFLLVRMAGAAAVRERAAAAGVLVRDVSHQPGLEDCLRISIGTPQENGRLLATLGTREAA
ncbi:MAG TPA: histidinol-phosphate transaminase, partial [Xanthomonadaceae bacterium]|nr:histidinol-phosphate transaminase [Xanthomonadaceae bacterium]